MSRSTDPSENSPDESGYVTSRFRRTPTTSEEYDPSEHSYHSDDDTAETPVRSPVTVLPSPAPEHPPQPARRLRVLANARKSVPLPVRVSFSIPSRDEGEPSRPRTRSVTPPPVIGVPVGRPSGMTALENHWVSGMARDMETYQARLDQFHHSINGLSTVLDAHNEFMDRTMEATITTRWMVRRLYTYLAMVIGVLVVMVGLLVWMMMH